MGEKEDRLIKRETERRGVETSHGILQGMGEGSASKKKRKETPTELRDMGKKKHFFFSKRGGEKAIRKGRQRNTLG